MKSAPPAPKGELIGYARVSTEDQKLDLQTDALKKVGCLNIYEEKKSGAAKNRPMLDLAIKDLRKGDTLVVWRIDRLARTGTELYGMYISAWTERRILAFFIFDCLG